MNTPPPMRLVVIESPYAGDVEANLRYARACLLDALRRGEAPLASHLLYTQVLNDDDPEERALGIRVIERPGGRFIVKALGFKSSAMSFDALLDRVVPA